MTETRAILEKIPEIKKNLIGYKPINIKTLKVSDLPIGCQVRYIKKSTPTQPAHVVLGGKLEEITEDRDNPGHIYRISIRVNIRKNFPVKLKDNTSIFLYYKLLTSKAQKQLSATAWIDSLPDDAREKFLKSKEERKSAKTEGEEGIIKNKFLIWLNETYPEFSPKKKPVKKSKTMTSNKSSKSKSAKKVTIKNKTKTKSATSKSIKNKKIAKDNKSSSKEKSQTKKKIVKSAKKSANK